MFIYNGKLDWYEYAKNECITVILPAAFALHDPVSVYWQWTMDAQSVHKRNTYQFGRIDTVNDQGGEYKFSFTFEYYSFDAVLADDLDKLTLTMKNPSNEHSAPFSLTQEYSDAELASRLAVYTGKFNLINPNDRQRSILDNEMFTLVIPYGVYSGAPIGLYFQWTVDKDGREKTNHPINALFYDTGVPIEPDSRVQGRFDDGYYTYDVRVLGAEQKVFIEMTHGNERGEGKARRIVFSTQRVETGSKTGQLYGEVQGETGRVPENNPKLVVELRREGAKTQEVLAEYSKLERRVKDLDIELQKERAKAWELGIKVEEVLAENSKLERRVKQLEHDIDEPKRSQITLSILESSSKLDSLGRLTGVEAQVVVDFLAEALGRQDLLRSNADRRHVLRLLSKLAKSAQVFPKRTELSGVQCDLTNPINDEGGFGFIYKGVFKEQAVCVKAVRVFEPSAKAATRVLRAQAGELALLAHVTHPNIIPLYGAYFSSEARPRICIVSPWMENGDLANYLRNFPNTTPILLLRDLAAGLVFLHDVGIIHADLKARNVLVSRSHRVMLADFGVSTVLSTNVGTTTSRDFAGTIFWMAPELLVPNDEGEMSPPTQQSDMWGFACVCFEALTGEIPFSRHFKPSHLAGIFLKGYATPLRPKRNSGPITPVFGPLETLVEGCWNYDPAQRPTAAKALQFLTELNVQDHRPSADEEFATFEAAKSGRIEVKIDYSRVLSIVQKK